MTKPTQAEFIAFALSHAKKETLPENALLPVPAEAVGTDPWEYLYGTTGVPVTQYLLDKKYVDYYAKCGWSRESYNRATAGWVARHAWVCDCEGLLDAFVGEDVNAQHCYANWCTDRGEIETRDHLLEIGEAVFKYNAAQKSMTHVGFVCGYTEDGDTLVVEERGLTSGCVITKLTERPWTHYGKPTARLDFSEPVQLWTEEDNDMNPDTPVVFKLESPMMKGDDVRDLQKVMNYWGYTDDAGDELQEDGKCGRKTMEALTAFVAAHAFLLSAPEPEPVTHTYSLTFDGFVVAEGEFET